MTKLRTVRCTLVIYGESTVEQEVILARLAGQTEDLERALAVVGADWECTRIASSGR